jgi:MoaA/NifB/PqqE/SkfB family radical SAM enzyme
MSQLDKRDWVCTQPFNFLELFDHKTFMCCPNWLPVNLGDPMSIETNWKSDIAEQVRESMLDGSYKFCIESRCPKLTGLKEGKTHGFVNKEEFLKNRGKYDNGLPTTIKMNFDQSCNLKCPSCRTKFINYEGDERERTEQLIEHIEQELSGGLEHIECTGSGDPFFSRTFRKWMMNFDFTKYPNLKKIHLHTNATLWNESNWSRMQNIHKYVKSCEISVDSSTKETYENKVRIGGKWEDIQNNLRFISELPYLRDVTISFVVQYENYQEMVSFYEMVKNIFSHKGKNWSVFYNRVVNWGTYTTEQFKKTDIGDSNHDEHYKLVEIYNQLPKTERIKHNLTL